MVRMKRILWVAGMLLLAAAVDVVRRPQDVPAFLNFRVISTLNSRGWSFALPDSVVLAVGLVLVGWLMLSLGSTRRVQGPPTSRTPVVVTLEFWFLVLAVAIVVGMFVVLERVGLSITSGLAPWILVFAWGCSYFYLLDRARGCRLSWELSRREWAFLGVLAIGGLVYWLYDGNSWRYSYIGDEVGFYVRAQSLAQSPLRSWDVLEASGEFGEVPMLVSSIQAACMKLFGISATSWRLSGALMAMVGVPFLYVYVKRDKSSVAAGTACFVYVASLLIAVWAKIGKPAAFMLPPMLLTMGFICMARNGSLLASFLAGSAAGVGFLLYLLGPLAAAGFLAVEFVVVLVSDRRRIDTLKHAGVVLLGWILGAIPMFVQTDFFEHWFAVKGKHDPLKQLYNTVHTGVAFLHFQASNHFVYGDACDVVTAWLVLLGIGYAIRYGRVRDIALFGICVFFTGTLAPYEYPPLTRLFFVVIAWAVLAGGGVEWIRQQVRFGVTGTVALVAMMILMLVLNLRAFTSNPEREINVFNQSLVRFAQAQSDARRVVWILPVGGNDWVENQVFGYLAPNVSAVAAPNALDALQKAYQSNPDSVDVFVNPDTRWTASTAEFVQSHGIPVHVAQGGRVEAIPAVPPALSAEQVANWPKLEGGFDQAPAPAAAVEIPRSELTGEPVQEAGLAAEPMRLAVGDDRSTYVLDNRSRQVFWRSPGSEEEHPLQDKTGQAVVFQSPSDIALGPAGRLYVLDAANSIAIFGVDRRLEKAINLGPLSVYSPRGLSVAPDGLIAIADAGNARVLVIDAEGQLKKQFGRPGRGDGELSDPMSVEFDGIGGVVVVDGGNGRIQRFAADGSLVGVWPRPGTAADVWAPRLRIDGAGEIWVAGGENEEIWSLPREASSGRKVYSGPAGRRIAGLDAGKPGELFVLIRGSGEILALQASEGGLVPSAIGSE